MKFLTRSAMSVYRLLPLVVSVFLLSSCLDINADIVLRRDGSADISLEYIFDAQGAEFGRGFGSDDPWPLPLTEKDFRLAALRNPDVSLRRYQKKNISEGRERIRAELRAESLEALSRYLGWNMSFQDNDSSRVLQIRIAAMNPQVTQSTRNMVENIIKDSAFSIRIKGWGKPRRVDGGQIERSSALFSAGLSFLVFSTEPILWSVYW